jgi:hypothetical protein
MIRVGSRPVTAMLEATSLTFGRLPILMSFCPRSGRHADAPCLLMKLEMQSAVMMLSCKRQLLVADTGGTLYTLSLNAARRLRSLCATNVQDCSCFAPARAMLRPTPKSGRSLSC